MIEMTTCKSGKCACCDVSTTIKSNITLFEKLRAHLKGDILGRSLNGREYYYLMFGCVNAEQIEFIKDCGDRLKKCIGVNDREGCLQIEDEIKKFKEDHK
jgi:hypothetical protein